MGRFNEKIFEAVSAGIICLDRELLITQYNQLGARSIGAAEGDDLSEKQFFNVASDNLFGLRIAFQKTLADKKKRTFWGHPVPLKESNEKTFWDFTVSELDGGILLSAVEVTDRVQAERSLQDAIEEKRELIDDLRDANRQLEEYNRLKAEFVANMSHELRTPLTAIIGFAQLMQMKFERGEAVKNIIGDGLERILRNGRHLLTLIDEVLDLSKIEAGRLTLHLDHFDLPELIGNAFGSLESLAVEKKLEYKMEVSGNFPFVFSDSARIRQILTNLISNAVKFTQEGKIEVKLKPFSDTEWQLSVSDTGMGIDPENISKIFERFRQVDGSYTRKVGGFGLGLSISQHLAELLGGKITVESEPGKGSKFIMTLPYVAPKAIRTLAPSMNGHDNSTEISEILENDEGRHSILVIDDIPDSTQILSQMLINAGFHVAVAHSGAEGIRIAKQIKPDAITLDVMMPGMDGWRVLQAMKADPQLAAIPVVVVSIVDNKPLGYRLGASDYLVKPVEPNNLLETLNGVIPISHEDHEDYILVVDDEQGVRELLLAALKQGGFKTRSAASGEIAFSLAQKHKPKAILTDLHMPGGMSGYELIARLRSQSETAHTPIVIITGKDLMEEDRRLVSGQIADVIRKGDLMLTDLDVRLRETLAEIGVTPTNGNHNVG
ncbi:MAG: response regulator [Pyrinomonadaceae bacterium]|nr:response regulator [Pyrinomonadaceae bacterium]